ncbi:aldehyde dehydrogenase family protein [Cereibacter johrii]|uniref:aldehyde dehydrogenase family protein n=1 Tax=Cereibacter johrii TaxID=445629 RepID=UPI002B25E146|nr:aldehyde dehydrogenase family protein [Cereibacter johrii]MEA5160706.1 aldehyde dehydrogenase family protein [Cereibacter johrii]
MARRQRRPDDPGTSERIGTLAYAEIADLDRALEAASRGFAVRASTGVFERCRLTHRAAERLRERAPGIAANLTREQGKPLAEARGAVLAAADIIDWFAEEGRSAYVQMIPTRVQGILQMTIKLPVGPVAALTPETSPSIRRCGRFRLRWRQAVRSS